MVDKIIKKLNKHIDINDTSINPVFLAGIAGALLTSLLDPLVSVLSYGSFGMKSLPATFLLMFITFMAFLVIYIFTILIVYSALEKIFPLNAIALAMSVSFAFVLLLLLPSINQSNARIIIYIINMVRFLASLVKTIYGIIIISFIAAILIYIIVKLTAFRKGLKERIASSGLSIPFILLETVLFAVICVKYVEHYISLNFLYVLFIYLLLIFSTAIIFRHPQKSSGPLKFIIALVFLMVFAVMLKVIAGNNAKFKPVSFVQKDHKIKHVILLSVDTLRKDMLSCYGGTKFRTDNIDKLAEDSVVFNNAISSSCWTIPSFASIMTGTYPHVHQMTERDSKLTGDLKTLAEYMAGNGYYSGAIGNNVYLSIKTNNLFQGFNYIDFYPKMEGQSSYITQLIGGLFPNLFTLNANTEELTDLAINWIEENRERDFFLWFHYIDPHVPYAPPKEYMPDMEVPKGLSKSFNDGKSIRYGYYISSPESRKWIKGLYEGEVRYVNDNIGRFIARLKELGIYDDSLIIFLSDHGEEFWDHDGYEHGHTLYNELVNIPLMIKLPAMESTGRSDRIVSTASTMPTILKLCDVAYDEGTLSVPALDLTPENEDNPFKDRTVYASGHLYFEDRESVIFDGYKYIHSLISDREELYNIAVDHLETNSIAGTSPELLKKAKSLIAEEHRTAREKRKMLGLAKEEKIVFDEETKDKLRALGYMN